MFLLYRGDFEGDMYEDTTVMDNDNSDDYEDMSSDFDEDGDDFNENDERLKMFSKEETKSRFTEYSMSSSVIRRNENLSYLDDTFEQVRFFLYSCILHQELVVVLFYFWLITLIT